MIDEQQLRKKYIEDGKSTIDIAQELGVSKKTVLRHLKKHNIKLRTLKQARKNRSNKGKEFRNITTATPHDIADYYLAGNSIQSTKEKFNISTDAIRHRLKALGVQRRKPWDHRIGSKHSFHTKVKMSKIATDQIINGTRLSYCQGGTYYCMSPNQDRIKVRSSWERDYADYLFKNNIDFYYEKYSFKLSNGKRYIPDFYLPHTNEYVEIKGYLSNDQKDKYKLFKAEYPTVNWVLKKKKDLKGILRSTDKPKLYIVAGISGSGKSWVCEQLTDKFNYLSYDKTPNKKNHISLMQDMIDKPILYDLNIKTSTFIRRHSHEFDIHFVTILGDFLTIKERLISRGGKITKGTYKRWKVMQKRTQQYAEFSGSSDEVLRYLKNIIV